MNFQRGIDPKSAMNIGIRKKISEVAQKIVEENMFNLANAELKKAAEKKFEQEVGLPVNIFIDVDHSEVMFNIKMPIKNLIIDLKIQ